AALRELWPRALDPASRLRRRYTDAPAGAPRSAPSVPAGVQRRFPPASKSGLLAAFVFLYETELWRVVLPKECFIATRRVYTILPMLQRGIARARTGTQWPSPDASLVE